MDKRAIKIIKFLYDKQTYVPQNILCDVIGIRPRTLREDLKKYKASFLLEAGVCVVNKNNLGYLLSVVDKELFHNFLNNKNSNNSIPVEQEDRIKYIIKRLLKSNDYIKINDIAEEIFVSKSTIVQDLKSIKEILNEYKLVIDLKAGIGIKINGDEKNFRRCMVEYAFNKHEWQYEKIIRSSIMSSIQEFNFKLSDFGIENLIIHITIAVYRIKDNISIDKCNYNVSDTFEFGIAKMITDKIGKELNIEFNESEISYITVHLLGNKVFDHRDATVIDYHTLNLVKNILSEIKAKYNIDFFNDIELFSMLATHIEPMLYRIKYDLKLTNPLLMNVKEENVFAYEIGLLSGEVVGKYCNKAVDENEIGY